MNVLLFFIRETSHFHGSLRRPTQQVTSPQQLTSPPFATLPASSYRTQPTISSIDGDPSLGSSYSASPGNATVSSVSTTTVTSESVSSSETCCLCDKVADAQLIPCKHIILCYEHAQSAKKCPECRVSCCVI